MMSGKIVSSVKIIVKEILRKIRSTVCRNTRLPDFLLVGYPKCGTTSLHYYLKQHPEVFLPKQKELHFFSTVDLDDAQLRMELFPYEDHIRDVIHTSYDRYRMAFCGCRGKKVVGEMTPTYALVPERVISNIYKYLPNPRSTKIIFVIRNPVEASFSHYTMQKNRGIDVLDFDDAFVMSQLWGRHGHYRTDHLGTFLFSKAIEQFTAQFDNVLVILNEDLKNNPQATMESVCKFLGVDERHSFRFTESHNVGEYKEYIANAQKNRLKEFYREDILRTQALVQRDLSDWL